MNKFVVVQQQNSRQPLSRKASLHFRMSSILIDIRLFRSPLLPLLFFRSPPELNARTLGDKISTLDLVRTNPFSGLGIYRKPIKYDGDSGRIRKKYFSKAEVSSARSYFTCGQPVNNDDFSLLSTILV